MNDFRGKRAELNVYDDACSQTIYKDALRWFKLRYELSRSETFKHYAGVAIDAIEKRIYKEEEEI